jgi:hypothetical protein
MHTRPDKTFQIDISESSIDDFLTLIFQLQDIKIRSNKNRHQIDIK